MNKLLIYVFILLGFPSFAQLEYGYNKEEVRDMIALCNSFTYLDLYNSDEEIIPAGYVKKYTSGVFGMDNKYQIYQKGNIAVINFRGSTDKKINWLENIHSAMIPAQGVIKVAGGDFKYSFASDSSAAVHSGYALGIAFLSTDILYHINILNREGIYHIILTGHSQGGALANMVRAYLENLSNNEIAKETKFKTYSFAAPMVGNRAFAEEYSRRYCVNNSSFNIVNPEDPIPTFPLSYNETVSLSQSIKSLLLDKESLRLKNLLTDVAIGRFEKGVSGTVKMLSSSASKQISKDVGEVVLPPFVEEINYQRLGNWIQINKKAYPRILRDSSILKNDSLMAIYKRGPDGHFMNKELYKKESWTFQHKPYNYYTTILEMYFPKEFYSLRRKYLAENL